MLMTEPTELERLRTELAELTRWRNETVKSAEDTIQHANKVFDTEALKLHRKIKKLEPPPEDTPVTPVTRNSTPRRRREPAFSLEGTEGWTQEEIDHYRELSVKQGRR